MKKIIALLVFLLANTAMADEYVNGYTKSNDTYARKPDKPSTSYYKPPVFVDATGKYLGTIVGPSGMSTNGSLDSRGGIGYRVILPSDYIFQMNDEAHLDSYISDYYETSDCSGTPTLIGYDFKGRIFGIAIQNQTYTLIYLNGVYYIPFDAVKYTGPIYQKEFDWGTQSETCVDRQDLGMDLYKALPNDSSVTDYVENFTKPIRLTINP